MDRAGIVIVEEYGIDGNRYRTRHYVQHVLEAKWIDYSENGTKIEHTADFSYQFDSPLAVGEDSSTRGIQYEKTQDGEEYKTDYNIGFSPAKHIAIGGCGYSYLEVKKEYLWPDHQDEETIIYLIELGLLIEIDPIPYNLQILEDGRITPL